MEEKQIKKEKKTKKPSFIKGFFFILFYFIFYYLYSGIYNSIASMFVIDGVPFTEITTVYNIFQSIIVFGIPPLLYCKFKKIRIKDALQFNKLNGKNVLYTIIIAILMMPILDMIVGILGAVFFGGDVQSGVTELAESGFLLTFISVAIVPAICEELTFRGMLAYKLKNLKPMQIAFLTTFIFSLVHLNFVQIIYTFFMGWCFFYLLHYTHSIWAPILAHFVINGGNTILIQLSAMFAKPEVPGAAPVEVSALQGWLELGLAFVCFVLLVFVFRKMKKENAVLAETTTA